MPDQVKVEARGREPVALLADGAVLQGEEHGVWKEGTVWRFYLRDGMVWKDLAFRLPEGMDGNGVGRVRLEKWKLFSLSKAGAGLERKDGESNEYLFRNSRFERVGLAQGKVPLGLLGAEVLLLGLSWGFAKRHREERWKTLLPSVLGVAFALALLMQAVMPVQSYMANRSAFPYTPGELGRAIAVRFGVALALDGFALALLVRSFGRWVLAPVFAFTACAYLESGILSMGLPSLNGNWKFFEDQKRSLWNGAVWGGVFLSTALAHRWVKRWYGVAGLCLAILVGLSLFDVHPEPKPDTSKWIVDEFSPRDTVVRSVVYAPSNNVFVFVIDSLECAQAHDIMEDPEAGPGLREQFYGFTEYTNNIGTGAYSAVAVANLFTGKYPENVEGIIDYYNSIFSEESVLKDFMDNEYAVFLSEDKHFTNRRNGMAPHATTLPVMKRHVLEGQRWTLPDINRLRWMPFAIKLRYLRLSSLVLPGGDFSREWDLYPVLGKADIDPNECGIFLFVHTEGVHVPVCYNRHGEKMPQADDSDAGCVEMGIHVLQQLGKLFDVYRKKGIYDDALILVMADHGQHGYLDRNWKFHQEAALPRTARPFLWVKPAGSRHKFETVSLPTSSANIADLLRATTRRVLSENDVRQLLESQKRVYRKILLLSREREDWIVDGEGQVHHVRLPLEKISDEPRRALQTGLCYSLDAEQIEKERLDIHFNNLFCQITPSFYPNENEMSMRFRVADPGRGYTVRIMLWMKQVGIVPDEAGACMQFCHGADSNWVDSPSGKDVEVVLKNLCPDNDGWIEIVGRRGAGLHSEVFFRSLFLEKSNI